MTAPNSTNLRESRKELAATEKPAPAKKAAPKTSAEKPRQGVDGSANSRQDHVEAQRRARTRRDEAEGTGTCWRPRVPHHPAAVTAWRATVKVGTKTTVLAEGVSGKTAWQKCVAHNKGVAA